MAQHRDQDQQWVMLPFGKWNPGASAVNAGELQEATGLIPVGQTYRGWLQFEESASITSAIGTSICISGIHSHLPAVVSVTDEFGATRYVDDQDTFWGYEAHIAAGADTARLYLNGVNVTPGTDYSGSIYSIFPWKFLSWGSSVLATCWAYPVQKMTYTSAGAGAAFADCITSTAKPFSKFIAALGSHVVLANIRLSGSFESLPAGPSPQTVWWSATDDETTFGSETSHPGDNTSYETLVDLPGEITGLAPVGDDSLLIFKPTGIHLMSRDGGFGLFSFRTIHNGTRFGTVFPESIVTDGQDVYYFNSEGVPMVCKGLGTPEPIVSEEFASWLLDRSDHSKAALGFPRQVGGKVVGAMDSGTRNILWHYHTDASKMSGSTYTDITGVGGRGIWLSTTTGRATPVNFEELFDWDGGLQNSPTAMASRLSCSAYESFVDNAAVPYGLIVCTRMIGALQDTVRQFVPDTQGAPTTNQVPWRVWTKPVSFYPSVGDINAAPSRIYAIRPVFRKGGTVYPCVYVTALYNPTTFTRDPFWYTTADLTMDPSASFVVSDSGVYSVPNGFIEGTFFEFMLSMPEFAPFESDDETPPASGNPSTDEVVGIQVLVGPAGDV